MQCHINSNCYLQKSYAIRVTPSSFCYVQICCLQKLKIIIIFTVSKIEYHQQFYNKIIKYFIKTIK